MEKKEWPILIGGVIIFSKEHFIEVNGYSNEYWGWGWLFLSSKLIIFHH